MDQSYSARIEQHHVEPRLECHPARIGNDSP
jgi:hypothetical protein